MERQLLARSRFFNSSQSLDELLQRRYSRTGDQKNFLILKPTGSNTTNSTSYNNSNSGDSGGNSSRLKQQPSLLHALQSNGLSEDPNSEENSAAKSIRDKNIPSNKVGPVNPNVQWDKRPVQTSQNNQNSRFAKKQVKRNGTKHQREKSRLLLEKKSKKTTRLVFRQYVKTTVAQQRKVAAIITKIRNDVKKQIEGENSKDIDSSSVNNNKYNKTSNNIISKKLPSLLTKHNIPQYQTYAHLSLLWHNYIADLLRLDKTSNLQQTLTKLSSAEFIGAIARIVDSNDTTLLNLTGLILYEFKNYYVFIIPSKLKFGPNVTISEQNNLLSHDADFDQFTASEIVGGLRLIEKKSCVFKIILPYSSPPPASAKTTSLSKKKQTAKKVEEPVSQTTEDNHEHQLRVDESNNFLEFLVIGARFNYKAIDRSNKKFKNHNVNDLGILMPKNQVDD